MATLAVNPTYDATLRKNGTGTFSGVRSGTTATSLISAAATTIAAQTDNASDGSNYYFDRPVLVFDTSALAGGAVTAATLAINITSCESPGLNQPAQLNLVAFNPANPASIATSDWQYIGTTALAPELAYNDNVLGVKTFTLNAAGLAAINASGYTCFALVTANDLNNLAAAGYCDLTVSPFYTYHTLNSTDAGSNKPLLTITYSAVTTASGSDTATATDSSSAITAARGTAPQDTATGTDASSAPVVSDPLITASQTGTATDSSSTPAVTSYKTGSDSATAWDVPASGGEASGPGPFLFWPGPWSEVQVVLTGTPISAADSGAAAEGSNRVVRLAKTATDTATAVDSSGNTGGPSGLATVTHTTYTVAGTGGPTVTSTTNQVTVAEISDTSPIPA